MSIEVLTFDDLIQLEKNIELDHQVVTQTKKMTKNHYGLFNETLQDNGDLQPAEALSLVA